MIMIITTTLLRNYNIVEIGQNTEASPGDLGACCHLDYSERSSANGSVKNFEK